MGCSGIPHVDDTVSPDEELEALKGIFAPKGVFAPQWVILALPSLAALGTYALPLTIAGVNLYAFRVVILLMAAFSTPLTSASGWWFDKLARRAMLLGLLWLTCGMLSLLWTPDLSGGMADVVSIGFGFVLLLILLNLRTYESQHLQLLRIGWVAAFLVTGAVAVWELVTGQHLYSGFYEGSTYYFDGTVVQSTLGRPDFYGQFLLVVTPFLLWSFYLAKGPIKLMHAGFLVAAGVLTLFTASRLSFIGFAAELLLLVFIFDRRWYVVTLGLASVAIGYVWWSNVFLSSDLRIASKFNSALSEEETSIPARVGMTLNGLWMVYDTAGRGVGAAGFRAATLDPDAPFRLARPKPEGMPAHNFWVQIASEYGILPVVGLVALLVFIARLALRAANRKSPSTPREVRILGVITLVGLVAYLFYGVVTGDPLRHSVQWMFFASLVVVGAHLYQAKEASGIARTREQGPPLRAGVLAPPGRRYGKIGREAPALRRAAP